MVLFSSPTGINCGSSCSATYSSGTSVTLTALPSSGSTFGGWSGGGCRGMGTCSIIANANTSVTATFNSASSPPPSPGGLVAAYAFNEGAGGAVSDASGRNNTGTISGATWTTQGKFSKALSFDGINDWVTVNDTGSLDLTMGMTLEAWVYPTMTQSDWRTIIQKEQWQTRAYYLHASSYAGALKPAGGAMFNGKEVQTVAPAAIPVNTWTYLAVTYDGAKLRLYVNGTQVSTVPQTGAVKTTEMPLRIGGNSKYGQYFKGRIDEVRIYNRALTASEIKTDMNKPL